MNCLQANRESPDPDPGTWNPKTYFRILATRIAASTANQKASMRMASPTTSRGYVLSSQKSCSLNSIAMTVVINMNSIGIAVNQKFLFLAIR